MSQRPLRTVFLLAILALGLSTMACDVQLTDSEYVETSETDMEWSPGLNVLVENSRGDLEIVEYAGDRVLIRARKRVVAPTMEKERELARQIRVVAERRSSGLHLQAEYPSGVLSNSRVILLGRDARRPRAQVDLTVQIPAGSRIRFETRSGDVRSEAYTGTLDVSSSSGDIYLDDWRGDCVIKTRSGDASILRVTGTFRMSSASGDLTGEEIGGDLEFTATSGDLQLSRVGGRLIVNTASGDVDVDRVATGVEIRTTSGDVEVGEARAAGRIETSGGDLAVSLRDPEGRFEVRTASGDVELHLVPPYGGRFEATTASGTIDAAVHLEIEQADRNRLTGRLGSGSQLLQLSTASGDIQVTGGERGGRQ